MARGARWARRPGGHAQDGAQEAALARCDRPGVQRRSLVRGHGPNAERAPDAAHLERDVLHQRIRAGRRPIQSQRLPGVATATARPAWPPARGLPVSGAWATDLGGPHRGSANGPYRGQLCGRQHHEHRPTLQEVRHAALERAASSAGCQLAELRGGGSTP